jgi:hypothetical protein
MSKSTVTRLFLGGVVTARLRGPRSRQQIAGVLAQVVDDAFLTHACSVAPDFRESLEAAIDAAAERSVEALVAELAVILELLPESAHRAWNSARLEASLGRE